MKIEDMKGPRVASEDIPIGRVVKSLDFIKATKASVVYDYEPLYKKKKPLSYAFYMEDTPMILTTMYDGEKETEHRVMRGDVILTGADREQWAMSLPKFIERYNVIETSVMTRPVHVMVAQVPNAVFIKHRLPIPYYFTAPWNERMALEPGDFLIKEPVGRTKTDGYYRVAQKAFFKSYLVNI